MKIETEIQKLNQQLFNKRKQIERKKHRKCHPDILGEKPDVRLSFNEELKMWEGHVGGVPHSNSLYTATGNIRDKSLAKILREMKNYIKTGGKWLS